MFVDRDSQIIPLYSVHCKFYYSHAQVIYSTHNFVLHLVVHDRTFLSCGGYYHLGSYLNLSYLYTLVMI